MFKRFRVVLALCVIFVVTGFTTLAQVEGDILLSVSGLPQSVDLCASYAASTIEGTVNGVPDANLWLRCWAWDKEHFSRVIDEPLLRSDGSNHRGRRGSAIVAYQDKLWVVYVADNSTNTLLITSSEDGVNWTNDLGLLRSDGTSHRSKYAPTMVVFNNKLWVVYVADNSTNTLLITSSEDGVNWTNDLGLLRPDRVAHRSKYAPTMVVFNNKLWVFYYANNDKATLLKTSSEDGVNWTYDSGILESDGTYARLVEVNPPLLNSVVVRGLIWVFYTHGAEHDGVVMGSSDGDNWTSPLYLFAGSPESPMSVSGKIGFVVVSN